MSNYLQTIDVLVRPMYWMLRTAYRTRLIDHTLCSADSDAARIHARLAAAEAWYVCLVRAKQLLGLLCVTTVLCKGHVARGSL